jgi:hypothetical protein
MTIGTLGKSVAVARSASRTIHSAPPGRRPKNTRGVGKQRCRRADPVRGGARNRRGRRNSVPEMHRQRHVRRACVERHECGAIEPDSGHTHDLYQRAPRPRRGKCVKAIGNDRGSTKGNGPTSPDWSKRRPLRISRLARRGTTGLAQKRVGGHPAYRGLLACPLGTQDDEICMRHSSLFISKNDGRVHFGRPASWNVAGRQNNA